MPATTVRATRSLAATMGARHGPTATIRTTPDVTAAGRTDDGPAGDIGAAHSPA
ncbi:hypothetical protein HD597_006426 [Nonomuraea thailandensis]|uniref:Uncharacterized protein n=1 Tax=Nonomuraea thailandensis TaxID=1188745 RepID=A0A9X2GIC7_9ACTN|nr:hypothetical protein [Nonomuraea thailandensis]MCP2359406.1 hypothetical protein [Nonomuraea thailandensis]